MTESKPFQTCFYHRLEGERALTFHSLDERSGGHEEFRTLQGGVALQDGAQNSQHLTQPLVGRHSQRFQLICSRGGTGSRQSRARYPLEGDGSSGHSPVLPAWRITSAWFRRLSNIDFVALERGA